MKTQKQPRLSKSLPTRMFYCAVPAEIATLIQVRAEQVLNIQLVPGMTYPGTHEVSLTDFYYEPLNEAAAQVVSDDLVAGFIKGCIAVLSGGSFK